MNSARIAIILVTVFAAIGRMKAQTAADQAAVNSVGGDMLSNQGADAQKLKELTESAILSNESKDQEAVSQASTMMASTARNLDAFGVPVIGDFLSAQTAVTPTSKAAPTEAVPMFVQAVQALKIVGLDLDKKTFFVGSAVMREGDVVTLRFKGQRITLNVESVGVNLVVFKDAETGQQAVSRPNIIPNMNPPQLQPMNQRIGE